MNLRPKNRSVAVEVSTLLFRRLLVDSKGQTLMILGGFIPLMSPASTHYFHTDKAFDCALSFILCRPMYTLYIQFIPTPPSPGSPNDGRQPRQHPSIIGPPASRQGPLSIAGAGAGAGASAADAAGAAARTAGPVAEGAIPTPTADVAAAGAAAAADWRQAEAA